jgi:hypothetical protein
MRMTCTAAATCCSDALWRVAKHAPGAHNRGMMIMCPGEARVVIDLAILSRPK